MGAAHRALRPALSMSPSHKAHGAGAVHRALRPVPIRHIRVIRVAQVRRCDSRTGLLRREPRPLATLVDSPCCSIQLSNIMARNASDGTRLRITGRPGPMIRSVVRVAFGVSPQLVLSHRSRFRSRAFCVRILVGPDDLNARFIQSQAISFGAVCAGGDDVQRWR